MVDTDTFLTVLYVMADDFCKCQAPPSCTPGPKASLTRSEVVTLIVFSQWARFRSERDFYRYAVSRLGSAFPTLPRRSQFNRLARRYYETLAAFSRQLVDLLQGQRCVYEALDSSGVPTRCAKRRGAGWLAGQADIGWSNRLGWYEGFHLLISVNPEGVITGFSFAAASVKDQALAEDFLAFRHTPHPRLPTLGAPARGWYVADKGFEGRELRQRWRDCYGARVISPPKRNSRACPQPRLGESLAQRIAPVAGRDTPDRGDGLRQSPPYLRAGPGAPPPTGGLSNQAGSQGRLAQLLYLVEPATGPPIAGFCRLAGVVTSPISHQAFK